MLRVLTVMMVAAIGLPAAWAGGIGTKDVSAVIKQAEEMAADISYHASPAPPGLPAHGAPAGAEARRTKNSLPDDRHAQSAREVAEEAMRRFRSPEYQAELRREQERLRQEVFAPVTPLEEEMQARHEERDGHRGALLPSERVYLFFSSSVPLETLREYLAVIEKARAPNIVMVMRGFVGGMKTVRPTLEYLARLLAKDSGCDPMSARCEAYRVNIEINPLLFRRYGIERVPTVVYVTGLSGEGEAANAYIIEGDAALDWLLERINREARSRSLDRLVKAMRGDD